MKSFFTGILTSVLIFSCFAIGYAQQNATENNSFTPNERPKLVVGIVIDQMRYEYLPRYWDKFGEGGFKRLVNNGYLFTNSHYNYFPTYTGPGHASIYTGTTPSVHGIVGNSWYNRILDENIYCVSDSTVRMVGGSGEEGRMSPEHLIGTTVTDELKKAIPEAKVIAVSIKDRAAVLPGGHLADGAFWYNYSSGNFITSTWYMQTLPSWLKAFNNKNLPQKYSQQVWKPLLPLNAYTESNIDSSPYESAFEGEDAPVFPHEMNGSLERIITSPFGNELVAELAKAAVKGTNLGEDEATDFLAVSFSSTDYVGHRFGPNSIEVEDTYLRLDNVIAGLLTFLDEQVGKGNYLLFLTSDHGAVQVPASLIDRHLPGGYFNSEMVVDSLRGYLKTQYGDENWIVEYENQQVYLNRELIKKKDIYLELLQVDVAQFLRRFDGVAATNTAYNFATIGYSEGLPETYQNGFYYGRSGDVYIQLKRGWLDSSYRKGTSHGSPYNYDTHVPLIFYGWRIPNGMTDNKTVIPQIAPTVAHMLHIQFPSGATNKLLEFK